MNVSVNNANAPVSSSVASSSLSSGNATASQKVQDEAVTALLEHSMKDGIVDPSTMGGAILKQYVVSAKVDQARQTNPDLGKTDYDALEKDADAELSNVAGARSYAKQLMNDTVGSAAVGESAAGYAKKAWPQMVNNALDNAVIPDGNGGGRLMSGSATLLGPLAQQMDEHKELYKRPFDSGSWADELKEDKILLPSENQQLQSAKDQLRSEVVRNATGESQQQAAFGSGLSTTSPDGHFPNAQAGGFEPRPLGGSHGHDAAYSSTATQGGQDGVRPGRSVSPDQLGAAYQAGFANGATQGAHHNGHDGSLGNGGRGQHSLLGNPPGGGYDFSAHESGGDLSPRTLQSAFLNAIKELASAYVNSMGPANKHI